MHSTSKSEAAVIGKLKKLRCRYVEADYEQTRSIARPLCDSWGSCTFITQLILVVGLPSWQRDWTGPIMIIVLFLVSYFNFLFVPCGRLSWLPVSFLLHVKYTLSYRSYRIVRWVWSIRFATDVIILLKVIVSLFCIKKLLLSTLLIY